MSQEDGAALSRHGNIIIVKRRAEEEESHHGGVWKIAFADFMTALMAFFLVMWLVNASDDATKRQVAQYFNPIKLNSATPPTPGLETGDTRAQTDDPLPMSGATDVPGSPEGKPIGGTQEGGEDQAIFRDPYAVLAEIVANGAGPGIQTGRSEPVPDGTGLPGLQGGEAYRDPFDPTSWQLQPNVSGSAPAEMEVQSQFSTLVLEPVPATTVAGDEGEELEASLTTQAALEALAPEEEAGTATEADRLEERLRRSTSPGTAAGIDVSEGEGGITISLADSLTNGMFEIGSARPNADTVRLVEEVAKILAEREGTIVIRGHTDARPYRGEDYDNWRLSTARAHMAYYMLLRGGFDESRISGIEGFADRRLKNEADPEAAENRRIEILLQEPAA